MDWIRSLHLRLAAPSGQTMVEYALLIGVIALVVILAAVFLGGSISDIFSKTATKV